MWGEGRCPSGVSSPHPQPRSSGQEPSKGTFCKALSSRPSLPVQLRRCTARGAWTTGVREREETSALAGEQCPRVTAMQVSLRGLVFHGPCSYGAVRGPQGRPRRLTGARVVRLSAECLKDVRHGLLLFGGRSRACTMAQRWGSRLLPVVSSLTPYSPWRYALGHGPEVWGAGCVSVVSSLTPYSPWRYALAPCSLVGPLTWPAESRESASAICHRGS